jgi:uncharacterized protein YjbI with pentapeptide repeats
MAENAARLFKKGAKEWNGWRRHHPRIELDFSGENLSNSDLEGQDLRRIKFDGAHICDANLSKCELIGASLKSALLQRTKLNRANLEEADMQSADLQWAVLDNARLNRANLNGANIEQATLRRACLHGATLVNANAMGTDFNSADLTETDLSGASMLGGKGTLANLSLSTLFETELSGCDLSDSKIQNSNLEDSILDNTRLSSADLSNSILKGVKLRRADLTDAVLYNADLSDADLSHATLLRTNFSGARLNRANLSFAQIVEANFSGADISDCSIYGMAAWGLELDNAKQANLRITPPGQGHLSVDNLEMAQFIYLLLTNKKIRTVIDSIVSKVVLVLGRFTAPRKSVLDRIRDELRRLGYAPVIFDFKKPTSRDLTETVSTLAHMSRFVIADITDAKSIPQELTSIVPFLPSVPIQPLLQADTTGYGMFEHFRNYPWVMEIYHYQDADSMIPNFQECVIEALEKRLAEVSK